MSTSFKPILASGGNFHLEIICFDFCFFFFLFYSCSFGCGLPFQLSQHPLLVPRLAANPGLGNPSMKFLEIKGFIAPELMSTLGFFPSLKQLHISLSFNPAGTSLFLLLPISRMRTAIPKTLFPPIPAPVFGVWEPRAAPRALPPRSRLQGIFSKLFFFPTHLGISSRLSPGRRF